LEEAVLAGKVPVAQLLIKRKAAFDPQALLFEVARANVHYRDVVEFLVRAGAQVDARDGAGQTALQIAVGLDERVLVKRLIDEGADVNLPGADGRTPLAIARQAGLQDIAQLLQRNGAVETP
jgi:ankyrin repeat protein